MNTYRLAVIGGDGVGPEVVEAGIDVLDALAAKEGGFRFEVTRFDWGSDHYRRTGRMMPDDGVEWLRD